ncbi:MAG: copper ion binding protein [Balneolaceae bacterium]|nr:copper ion binding protein [Balneolaceae bacterium]
MKKTFDIYGMHCAGCVNNAEKALSRVEGVKSVSVQLATEKAVVEFENGDIPFEKLNEAVSQAGFELKTPKLQKVTFEIEGMHCAGCTNTVEKAIKQTEGVQSASVNLATGTAVAEFEGTDEVINRIGKHVEAAGYSAKKKALTAQIS